MNEKFANSPLIELVAEVRWKTEHKIKQPVLPGEDLDLQEQFFTNLAGELASKGYVTSERLVPNGFPLVSGLPVVRFKKSPSDGTPEQKAKDLSTLYQVGVGLFTINAIQPYSCWEDFIQVIRTGLEALLSIHSNKVGPGFQICIRYIDGFGESFTDGLSLRMFLSQKLGLNIGLPTAFEDEYSNGDSDIPGLRIRSPLEFGTHIVNFAEGNVKSQPVYIMENIVKFNKDIEGEADKLIAEMTLARDVIHKRFLSITHALHSIMQPV